LKGFKVHAIDLTEKGVDLIRKSLKILGSKGGYRWDLFKKSLIHIIILIIYSQ
jgi:hypothetical protein